MADDNGKVRNFDTGATRDTAEGKYDYEGFLSPLVLERYAEYMHSNRKQSDGSIRDSDNWQKGIPKDVYMKSGYRHFFDWWMTHRGYKDALMDALCGLMFNVMGYMHEHLKDQKSTEASYDGPVLWHVPEMKWGETSPTKEEIQKHLEDGDTND